jgi:hypothetical protein
MRVHLATARIVDDGTIRLRLNVGTSNDVYLEMSAAMAASIATALVQSLASDERSKPALDQGVG